MGFSKAFTEELKNQADIVRIISDYVTLKRRGKNYQANCPFHNEKTPSFNVNPAMQIFHCFGCSVGGNVFSFIMQIERCDFIQAVKLVAEKVGVELPKFEARANDRKISEERDDLLQVNLWATEFFQEQLGSGAEGQRALEYFDKRGINEETRALLRLGYAPDKWDALSTFLRAKGASVSQIERSGLVIVKEGGGHYDRFRGRCMFPITDAHGRVIAFGGRIIAEGEPKYLNSPETLLYSKGRNLYGLSFAKEAIRKQRFAILVEGYLDFVIPYQEGVQNIVASLGTALTDHQVRLLSRYMDQPQIVVNFDPDTAGVAATKRSLEILLEQGYKVNVLSLPDGEDPDTFIRKHGAAEYRQLLKKSQPYLDYILTQSMREHDTSRPAGKVETLNAILPFLTRVRDRIERSEYAEQIADRLKLDGKVVREELKRAAMGKRQQLDPKKITTLTRVLPAESHLLKILLSSQRVRERLAGSITPELFEGLVSEPIFAAILQLTARGSEVNFAQLIGILRGNSNDAGETAAEGSTELLQSEKTEAQSENNENESAPMETDPCESLLAGLMIDSEEKNALEEAQLLEEAESSLSALRRTRLEQQQTVLQLEINQAQRAGDATRIMELIVKKQELARRLNAHFN